MIEAPNLILGLKKELVTSDSILIKAQLDFQLLDRLSNISSETALDLISQTTQNQTIS